MPNIEEFERPKESELQLCVPLWLRDIQLELSNRRGLKVVQPHPSLEDKSIAARREPIAIVCFGPSLNDTWEQVRGFKYVMSCSGSHKFLVERGVVPTHHIEVDPRPHKVKLIGAPQRGTKYMIASTCNPQVFEHLKGCDVELWHVYDDKAEAMMHLKQGEWAMLGGSNVGLRALTMARYLGFTDLHVFGMDGCFGASGHHAAEHPNNMGEAATCEIGGKEYMTTPILLEYARQTFHELDQMPDLRATFYGDGLVQEMAKTYVRRPSHQVIAVQKPIQISRELIELNRRMHEVDTLYGTMGIRYAESVLQFSKMMGTTSILDYGCGKGTLAKMLPFPIWEYDPSVPGKDAAPRQADIVVCTDVLEHVEEDKLIFVLNDIRLLAKRAVYIAVHTGSSRRTYDDGRNTHLIQRDVEWWYAAIGRFFEIFTKRDGGTHLQIVASPRAEIEEIVEKREEVAA